MEDLRHVSSQIGVSLEDMTRYQQEHHGKPYPISLTTKLKIGFENTVDSCLDLSSRYVIEPLVSWSFGWFLNTDGFKYRKKVRIPDSESIYKMIVTAHAHEVFFGGVFNADPHPGNII